ncbi:MAG: corrinoid protein-associated methyltransferase CpaM [Candidatus Aerophobetes bacterium]|nr:corrinoid protein-associated methyltransferase CpaM [Candidatus Aerophobetes bacterium]
MSTYILMKILEFTPGSYDRGIHILTLGKLDRAYNRLTSHIKRGQRVLDLGCGTGALTLRAAKVGAKVKGIDVNSQMLDIAQRKASETDLTQNIELCEMGVAELESEEAESYDIVMSGLSFSELTEDELIYTLKEVRRILEPGGLLLIADEVIPENISKRILNWLIRPPLVIITYLITQTTTQAVKNLPKKINQAGLIIESVRLERMESFIEVVARKPEERTK